MKKFCYIILCILLVSFLFSACDSKPAPTDTPATQGPTSSIKTDDLVWYSEETDIRGRIWLGMTEKEVYDVLNKYNITIYNHNVRELDEYGAEYLPPECYYKKCLCTDGYQFFYFDKEDHLMEICYFDQMHAASPPVNEEFETHRGVKRRDNYEDMIKAYGDPDKIVNLDSSNQSYVYRLENGDYLHFVYQGTSTPIQSIHYSKYPYLFSY